MIDLVKNYSIMARRMKRSVIRELLKMSTNPGLISFAGGLPDAKAFPIEVMEDICASVIRNHGARALQYGITEGETILVDELIKLHAANGIPGLKRENILVTVASQQALDLVGRIFIDHTDPIITECPTYLGGLQAFRAYGALPVGIPMDDDGILVDRLEPELKKLRSEEEHYKFLYLVPDFQNPSGVTLSLERRKRIVQLSEEYNFLIVEDSPYRDLRYEGEHIPTIYSLDKTQNVIGLYTFSKIFVPGMRLGWIIAHPAIIEKLVVAKQAVDLCTPAFTQYIAAEFCRRGLLEGHIEKVKAIYKTKKDAMLDALKTHMPDLPGLRWTKPDGGLFLWLELPAGMNADEMIYKAIDAKVAYVIGSAFFPQGGGLNTMRLNFSAPSVDDIYEGMKRLGAVIRKEYRPA